MGKIEIRNLTFAYDGGGENIFENVDLTLDTDWKLGFVGRNGRGKTTFLRLLTGAYEHAGKITASVRFAYFPFAVHDPERPVNEILREICPRADDWEFLRELSYLDASAELWDRAFCTLSGGEQTKALLAGMFLNDNDFMLIDEPTNHLDAEARRTVAAYLRRKKGFVLVSHDRAFLDGCVDHILCLHRATIELQAGNFSSFSENFRRRQAFETARNEHLQKDIARLTEAARQTATWAERTENSKYGKTDSGLKPDKGYVGHKAAKMMQRRKATQGRIQNAIEQKKSLLQNAERCDDLKLCPLRHNADRLAELSGVTVRYGAAPVCPPQSFCVSQGERIALCGKNGCGKSSILRLLAGEDVPHDGTVRRASGLIVSYVPQITAGLCGDLSAFARAREIDESLFKAVLHKTGFTKEDFDTDIAAFSQGQKKKVLLAASLCAQAHLYVWDEPLNYIDVYARMQIENVLKTFAPTLVFAEHDAAFRDAVATRVIQL